MDKLTEFRELAFGSRMKRLSDSLMRDVKQVYKRLQLDFDPSLFALFKTVAEEQPISISELTSYLHISQPAVTQFANALIKKQLFQIETDANDKRKKMISLSSKGELLLEQLNPIWNIIEAALTDLIDNPPTSFMNHIRLTEQKHREVSLYSRIMRRIGASVTIIPYHEHYAKHFHDLNIAWLKKYFYVEAHDSEVLENPQSYILDNGGFIFFAVLHNEVVGTVALINEEEGFELSKMAVDPKYQGLKIGQLLMQHAIDFAKNKGWNSLLLYSNTTLENAIYIYRKFGFIEVPIIGSPYSRGNIKMVLKLG